MLKTHAAKHYQQAFTELQEATTKLADATEACKEAFKKLLCAETPSPTDTSGKKGTVNYHLQLMKSSLDEIQTRLNTAEERRVMLDRCMTYLSPELKKSIQDAGTVALKLRTDLENTWSIYHTLEKIPQTGFTADTLYKKARLLNNAISTATNHDPSSLKSLHEKAQSITHELQSTLSIIETLTSTLNSYEQPDTPLSISNRLYHYVYRVFFDENIEKQLIKTLKEKQNQLDLTALSKVHKQSTGLDNIQFQANTLATTTLKSLKKLKNSAQDRLSTLLNAIAAIDTAIAAKTAGTAKSNDDHSTTTAKVTRQLQAQPPAPEAVSDKTESVADQLLKLEKANLSDKLNQLERAMADWKTHHYPDDENSKIIKTQCLNVGMSAGAQFNDKTTIQQVKQATKEVEAVILKIQEYQPSSADSPRKHFGRVTPVNTTPTKNQEKSLSI